MALPAFICARAVDISSVVKGREYAVLSVHDFLGSFSPFLISVVWLRSLNALLLFTIFVATAFGVTGVSTRCFCLPSPSIRRSEEAFLVDLVKCTFLSISTHFLGLAESRLCSNSSAISRSPDFRTPGSLYKVPHFSITFL